MHHFTMVPKCSRSSSKTPFETLCVPLYDSIVSSVVDGLRYTEKVSLLPAFPLIVSIISSIEWTTQATTHITCTFLATWKTILIRLDGKRFLRFWTKDPLSSDQLTKRVSDPIFK